jgi:hypothetical protein
MRPVYRRFQASAPVDLELVTAEPVKEIPTQETNNNRSVSSPLRHAG